MAIHVLEKILELPSVINTGETRVTTLATPQNGVMYLRATVAGTITKVIVYQAENVIGNQAAWNVRKNDTQLFSGASRPIITDGNSSSIKSGLSFPVVVGDVFKLDFEEAPKGGSKAPVVLQIFIDDGVSSGGGGGSSTLATLTDVNVPAPTDGQALVWDSGTTKWVAETVSSGSGALASDIIINDTFTSGTINAGVWVTGSGVSQSGGKLVITNAVSSALSSLYAYDVRNTQLTVEVVTTPTAAGNRATQLGLSNDNFTTNRYINFDIFNGDLRCGQGGAGAGATVNITYNSTNHRFLRLLIIRGYVFYQTSSDGNTFVTQHAIPQFAGLDTMKIYLSQYNISGGTYTSELDNFKLEGLREASVGSGVDKAPASPYAQDDEFTATALDVKWTESTTGTAPTRGTNIIDSNYVAIFGNAEGAVDLTQAFAPASADFSFTAKFSCKSEYNYQGVAIALMNSGLTDGVKIQYAHAVGVRGLEVSPFVAFGSVGVAVTLTGELFLHIQRDAGVWSIAYSYNGISWYYGTATSSKAVTVAKLQIQLFQSGATVRNILSCDWIRKNWITL